ncbi:hypothetical protein ACFW1A_23745 [Kitasatospora sp. NPDC058965]|uniref:hypothetical protein n=1 Tax=Kitasatospora sp. NPDC058965 TaxID=3346682 RepID=UPI00369FF603
MTQKKKSRLTLHVYRIGADGTRTDLGSDEITAGAPYDPFGPSYELPCRCRRCTAARQEQADEPEAVA